MRGKPLCLGKYSAIKAGNNQLMSEQFPLVSPLQCTACSDTSGNSTSVLCGEQESTIRLTCSMTNHAAAQPALVWRIKKHTVCFQLKWCKWSLICAAHMYPLQVNYPTWLCFQLHYVMNPSSEVRQINKSKIVEHFGLQIQTESGVWGLVFDILWQQCKRNVDFILFSSAHC